MPWLLNARHDASERAAKLPKWILEIEEAWERQYRPEIWRAKQKGDCSGLENRRAERS